MRFTTVKHLKKIRWIYMRKDKQGPSGHPNQYGNPLPSPLVPLDKFPLLTKKNFSSSSETKQAQTLIPSFFYTVRKTKNKTKPPLGSSSLTPECQTKTN